MESFAWSMPPSAGGSVPGLCVFLAGILAVTITLFVRHEKSTDRKDWVFRKSDAHRCISSCGACLHPGVLLVYRCAVFGFCMYSLSSQYQGAMFYTCVLSVRQPRAPLRANAPGLTTRRGLCTRARRIWNFSLLTLYFFVATINSAMGCFADARRDSSGGGSTALLGEKSRIELAGWPQKLQLVLLEIEAPAAFLIDLVVWTVLVPAADGAAAGECQAAADSCTQQYALSHNETVAECIAHVLHNSTVAECEAYEYRASDAAMVSALLIAATRTELLPPPPLPLSATPSVAAAAAAA